MWWRCWRQSGVGGASLVAGGSGGSIFITVLEVAVLLGVVVVMLVLSMLVLVMLVLVVLMLSMLVLLVLFIQLLKLQVLLPLSNYHYHSINSIILSIL